MGYNGPVTIEGHFPMTKSPPIDPLRVEVPRVSASYLSLVPPIGPYQELWRVLTEKRLEELPNLLSQFENPAQALAQTRKGLSPFDRVWYDRHRHALEVGIEPSAIPVPTRKGRRFGTMGKAHCFLLGVEVIEAEGSQLRVLILDSEEICQVSKRHFKGPKSPDGLPNLGWLVARHLERWPSKPLLSGPWPQWD